MFIMTDMDLDNDMMALGRQIREARKQRGLRQADIAKLISIRRQIVSELERGVYKGSLSRAMEVLRAMGLRLVLEPVRFPTLEELSDE